MGHTYSSNLSQVVFSTRERRSCITPDLAERLWPYLGGIARENGCRALEIGGVADHVHLLLSLPTNVPISRCFQLVKGGSSKWIHDQLPAFRDFSWQEGYGAFSIGVSPLDVTRAYIQNQERHYRTMSF